MYDDAVHNEVQISYHFILLQLYRYSFLLPISRWHTHELSAALILSIPFLPRSSLRTSLALSGQGGRTTQEVAEHARFQTLLGYVEGKKALFAHRAWILKVHMPPWTAKFKPLAFILAIASQSYRGSAAADDTVFE